MATTTHPDNPYPGLRFYGDSHADFFAGREDQAYACAKQLASSRVLVLHGRSGCGKSSFLRAGVKPLLAQSGLGLAFSEREQAFDVIRCTKYPLRAFADKLVEIVKDLAAGNSSYGELRSGKDGAALVKNFTEPKFLARIRTRAAAAHRALRQVAESVHGNPIIVIDQGEEVFTLREALARKREANVETSNDDAELEMLQAAAEQFFALIAETVSEGAGTAHLVVSLRTEYAGQFSDSVYGDRSLDGRLRGYFLPELDHAGLVDAIVRPTSDAKTWKNYFDAGTVRVEQAPSAHFKFRYQAGVADSIASELLGEGVPDGGVLPTLQVACQRLWMQAHGGNQRTRSFVVKDIQRRRLGPIKDQIQEYVAMSLGDACADTSGFRDAGSAAVESWQHFLKDALVTPQPDGRALTNRLSRKELHDAARMQLGEKKKNSIDRVIATLESDEVSLLRGEEQGNVLCLGHDSIALALQKWSLMYEHNDHAASRMMMLGELPPDRLKERDLFPGEGHGRHEAQIVVPRMLDWDRLFPIYAEKRGFGKRLGITFVTDDSRLYALAPRASDSPKDWPALHKALLAADDQARKDRKSDGKERRRVMVPADWHSFPGAADAPKKTGRTTKRTNTKQAHDRRVALAGRWSDVLVTDLFVGNGLIGPSDKWSGMLDGANKAKPETRLKQYRKLIKGALDEIVEVNGEVRCHDQLGLDLLEFSAKLVRANQFLKLVKPGGPVRVFEDQSYATHDPLVEWLLEEGDEKAPPRYIVGSAMSRAMAMQAGFAPYFSTSQVTRVVRDEIDKSRIRETIHVTKKAQDLAREVQKVIRHTVWQLGVPPSQWNHGLNRALVLRLASVGYFTTEYVRTHADDFVLYLKSMLDSGFRITKGGELDAIAAARINREIVRESYHECYRLLRFDEVGAEFFDPESTIAYTPEFDEFDSKSIAGEVYNELCMLRQRTTMNAEAVARSIAWLRSKGAYNILDRDIERVTDLKRCAWNNYRIFNFYDSARLMAEASLLLQSKMEAVMANDE